MPYNILNPRLLPTGKVTSVTGLAYEIWNQPVTYCEVLLHNGAVNSHVMCIMPHVSLAWAQGALDMRSALDPLHGLLIIPIDCIRLITTCIASTIPVSLHAAKSPSAAVAYTIGGWVGTIPF